MNQVARYLRDLCRNQRGGAAVEFALVAPVFIAMLLGILQIAVGMQSYNALRNIASDAARHALVESQVTTPTDIDTFRADLDTWATTRATSSPYLLRSDLIDVTVTEPTTQRVADATELSIALSYEVPTFLTFMGWTSPTITFTRPVFISS